MVYITVRQSPIYHQMSLDEFLGLVPERNPIVNDNKGNTKTYAVEQVSDRFMSRIDVPALIAALQEFNESTAELRAANRHDLYISFCIPKHSGGLRHINAPVPELMEALRRLKKLFEDGFGALYHTSAFAYIKNRCTLDAVKRHQANESKWFAKFDLHDFFGSTTLAFVMQQFSMIFPFSEVVKVPYGRQALEDALELCFLDGGLPQGTPISPLITNIMMIPLDFKMNNAFRDFNGTQMVETRYADDFIISSKYSFMFRDVEAYIESVLREFGAPFSINRAKTRYGSSNGANWNLGVMLNQNNEITVGHRNKKNFRALVSRYVEDKKNGVQWSLDDVRHVDGLRSYYTMVEGDTIREMLRSLGEKFGINIERSLREDIKRMATIG